MISNQFSLDSVKAIERVCGLGSALAKCLIDIDLSCLRMIVGLDVLNQVSESCPVLHRGNLLALDSVCVDSALAHNLLLTCL
jgi:hypothetical protein